MIKVYNIFIISCFFSFLFFGLSIDLYDELIKSFICFDFYASNKFFFMYLSIFEYGIFLFWWTQSFLFFPLSFLCNIQCIIDTIDTIEKESIHVLLNSFCQEKLHYRLYIFFSSFFYVYFIYFIYIKFIIIDFLFLILLFSFLYFLYFNCNYL